MKLRNLVVVLGDQLNADSAAFDDFDRKQDAVWMAEVDAESKHVWTHKARIALFLSAMRHFRDSLTDRKFDVRYRQLEDPNNTHSLAGELEESCKSLMPRRLIMVSPGEWRLKHDLEDVAKRLDVELVFRPDRHFLCTPEEFADHAEGRKQLRLEYFYRELRKKHDVLIEHGKPVGGKWNYDKMNRSSFGKKGPLSIKKAKQFTPDEVTQEVFLLVEERFADHPGSLGNFDWPVTADQARQALDDFVQNRLASFGQHQDAMWTGEPYLNHSRISAAMNLKLLDPRTVIQSARDALDKGEAPLNSVEGFVRQVLGWREYVHGVYWLNMPEYLQRNALEATQPLPPFFWTGDTDMHCLRQAIGQTLEFGYAHHIQRLMVTGLFCLLVGVDPRLVHEWYLAVYVDAVEWVELPNSLGMSQFADGGVMASKPYIATGKYIQRMSNYCDGCRFDPARALGEDACPFTTLYWDFLERHREELSHNNRMTLQLKNLDRKSEDERKAIGKAAAELRESFKSGSL
jgi:deoxyribodipyrimidine photolyase-related protein